MAANVETTLELGLREAAETVWARKVLLEALGPSAPFAVVTLATHAHGKAIGRVEGTALALELIRREEDTDDDPIHALERLVVIGAAAGELVQTALAEVGELVWDKKRLEEERAMLADLVALAAIPLEVSWSAASTAAALRPLYPPTKGPR